MPDASGALPAQDAAQDASTPTAPSGPFALGIDAGGSSTRWLLMASDGSIAAAGRVGPVSGIQLHDEARATTLARIHELLAACQQVGRPERVVAGVTGIERGSHESALLQHAIAETLALAPSQVTVLPDIVTAYLSTFRPGAGVLVYAGTGSIALHLTAGGNVLRAGGHGYLIDDEGGGYWIGREALKRVLRRTDAAGATDDGPLARALYGELGGSSWDHVRSVVYQGGRARLAALTPAVAMTAARGDADARAVLAAAGTELARLAQVVAGRLGQVLPVALAGGVARCGPALVEPLRTALPAGTPFTVATREPVEASAEFARRLLQGSEALPAGFV